MDEPTPLKLLGAHLVRELEKLGTLGFDGDRTRAFRLKEVEITVPFTAPAGVVPEPVVIGGQEPLTAVEVINSLDRVKEVAFIDAGRMADAPVNSIAVLRLRMKF